VLVPDIATFAHAPAEDDVRLAFAPLRDDR
jgi:hypothetical protein